MPRYPIDRATNFIVEEESWSVIEYDHTSVPGIIYLSLTENKINLIYDDVDNNIADLDKMADYQLSVPSAPQTFKIGEPIEPIFTLMKNGKICDEEIGYKTADKKVVRFVDDVLTAVGAGTTDIIIYLKKYPNISKTLTIKVSNEEKQFMAYIDGNNSIKLDRQESYTLIGTEEINDKISFHLENTDLAALRIDASNKCTVIANARNKLGKVILVASYNGIDYTKEISIIPLW